jgi:hypothetical protein
VRVVKVVVATGVAVTICICRSKEVKTVAREGNQDNNDATNKEDL